jgi:hypothetical protein
MATVKNHLNARGGLRRPLVVLIITCSLATVGTRDDAGSAVGVAQEGLPVVSQTAGKAGRAAQPLKKNLSSSITIVSQSNVSSSPRPTYGWPLKPFDRPHPVRAYLNDPRISADGSSKSFHFGIDIGVPKGTQVPVYAVDSGTAKLADDGYAIEVSGMRTFAYWHVVPVVRSGQFVRRHQLIGRSMGWNHIHFGEYSGGQWINPLRPGGLGPFFDRTVPTLERLTFERNHVALDRDHVNGTSTLVLAAFDTAESILPGPWPVVPASIRWRVIRGAQPVTGWHTVLESQSNLPKDEFGSVYAAGTAQNHPGRPGHYRFSLAKAWSSRSLPNGSYAIEIKAADIRSNAIVGRVSFTVDNG